MNFIKNTQEELRNLTIKNNEKYTIEYLNRDYFNGIESLERVNAQAIISENGEISFLIEDDYGMHKFIKDAKIIY